MLQLFHRFKILNGYSQSSSHPHLTNYLHVQAIRDINNYWRFKVLKLWHCFCSIWGESHSSVLQLVGIMYESKKHLLRQEGKISANFVKLYCKINALHVQDATYLKNWDLPSCCLYDFHFEMNHCRGCSFDNIVYI